MDSQNPSLILVDTSVWIDHLRAGDENLVTLLDSTQILAHPFVIGELACGTFAGFSYESALSGKSGNGRAIEI